MLHGSLSQSMKLSLSIEARDLQHGPYVYPPHFWDVSPLSMPLNYRRAVTPTHSLYGFWEIEVRSSRLCGKHFANQSIPNPPHHAFWGRKKNNTVQGMFYVMVSHGQSSKEKLLLGGGGFKSKAFRGIENERGYMGYTNFWVLSFMQTMGIL